MYGPKKKKFFLEKRTLLLLITIVLMMAAIAGTNYYKNKKASSINLSGSVIELNALTYNKRILASLKAEGGEESRGGIVEVQFYFYPETIVTVTDILPSQAGEVRYLRAEFDLPENKELTLKARIITEEGEILLEKIPQGE